MESQTRVKENSELHPVRRARSITQASLKKLGEDLQLSVEGFLPKTSAPYKKVTCLLIAWEHAYEQDEGGVAQDFDEFRGLMLEHYHFEVDEYLVDRIKPQRTIEREMMDKCTQVRSQQDELVIIYYAGHSYYQEWSRHTIFSSNRMNDPDRRWRREIDFHQSMAYLFAGHGYCILVVDH